MMHRALVVQLKSHTGLAALVGTKIYPVDRVPEGTSAPYCEYMEVSRVRQYSHGGYSGVERILMQIDCYAGTYDGAKAVAAQVTAAMEAWDDSKVQGVFKIGETDWSLEQETGLSRVVTEFYVWYESD